MAGLHPREPSERPLTPTSSSEIAATVAATTFEVSWLAKSAENGQVTVEAPKRRGTYDSFLHHGRRITPILVREN
jgi:hypothetical protein